MSSRTTWLQHLICLLVVAVAVTWLFSALLEPFGFTSHDGFYAYARTQQVASELSAGRFPQTFPDAFFGAGFAFPRFYPPFTLFLSAGIALLLGNVVVAVNLTFFLSVLASGFTMYAMMVGLLRDRWIALGASLLYVSMPYRFVDIYVRAALAEAWTFVWYPLIVLGLWRAITKRTMPWYLPVSICALVLTHNITAVYFVSYCALLTMFAMAIRGWRIAIVPAISAILGILLAMWFLLPQQYYMSSVWVSDAGFMWTNAAHVQDHRVMPWQFFYSLPDSWFEGSSGPGQADGMSYELGIGQLLLLPVMLLMAKTYTWRMRIRQSVIVTGLGMSALVGYVASLLFMVYPVAFLSILPKQFAFIQFPWRLLALTAFLAPILCGIGVSRIVRQKSWIVPVFAATSMFVVILVPSFQSTPRSETVWTDDTLLSRDMLYMEGSRGYTVLGEYLPRELDIRSIRRDGLDPALYRAPIVVDGADASVADWTRSGPEFRVSVDARKEAVVRIPLFYYDFYKASTTNGKPLTTVSVDGMLGVRVPAGITHLIIDQRLTSPSKVGLAISALAAILLAGCAVWFRDRQASKRPEPSSRLPDLGPMTNEE